MKKQVKPDWIKIEVEFEVSDISLKQLAEKHKVPYETISARARRGSWAEIRAQTQQRLREVTLKKIEKLIHDEVDKILEGVRDRGEVV